MGAGGGKNGGKKVAGGKKRGKGAAVEGVDKPAGDPASQSASILKQNAARALTRKRKGKGGAVKDADAILKNALPAVPK